MTIPANPAPISERDLVLTRIINASMPTTRRYVGTT